MYLIFNVFLLNLSKKIFENEKIDVNFVTLSSTNYVCRLCKNKFYFNNKFHRYIRICRQQKHDHVNNTLTFEKIFHEKIVETNVFIVEFEIFKKNHVEYNFRK